MWPVLAVGWIRNGCRRLGDVLCEHDSEGRSLAWGRVTPKREKRSHKRGGRLDVETCTIHCCCLTPLPADRIYRSLYTRWIEKKRRTKNGEKEPHNVTRLVRPFCLRVARWSTPYLSCNHRSKPKRNNTSQNLSTLADRNVWLPAAAFSIHSSDRHSPSLFLK